MPDHGGWSPFDVAGVGSYRVFRDDVRLNERPFADKIKKAVYRGTKHLNEMREHLVEVTKDKQWADAAHTSKENHILAHKFCDYQYLFHVEGQHFLHLSELLYKYLANAINRQILVRPSPLSLQLQFRPNHPYPQLHRPLLPSFRIRRSKPKLRPRRTRLL